MEQQNKKLYDCLTEVAEIASDKIKDIAYPIAYSAIGDLNTGIIDSKTELQCYLIVSPKFTEIIKDNSHICKVFHVENHFKSYRVTVVDIAFFVARLKEHDLKTMEALNSVWFTPYHCKDSYGRDTYDYIDNIFCMTDDITFMNPFDVIKTCMRHIREFVELCKFDRDEDHKEFSYTTPKYYLDIIRNTIFLDSYIRNCIYIGNINMNNHTDESMNIPTCDNLYIIHDDEVKKLIQSIRAENANIYCDKAPIDFWIVSELESFLEWAEESLEIIELNKNKFKLKEDEVIKFLNDNMRTIMEIAVSKDINERLDNVKN